MLLVIVLSWQLLCQFLCSFFAFLVSISYSQNLLSLRNFCVWLVNLFQKSGFWSLLCGFSWKMGYFDFSYSVGSLPFLYIKIRVLGQVHHLSLLICYLYLFICFRVININSLKFEKADTTYIITIFLFISSYWGFTKF